MNRILFTLFVGLFFQNAVAQQLNEKDLANLHRCVDAIADSVAQQPDWLVSRLQMYWITCATDVFIKGEAFDHPGGDRATVPTVKLDGTRSHGTDYRRPRLEDIVPYDDDEDGRMTLVHGQTGVKERVHPSKAGRIPSSLNRQIMGLARDAAKLYVATGEKCYYNVAFPVFDTFMKGIYYRNVPIDLTHSHIQTLVGMTSFEVIHEDVINECTELYRLIRPQIPQATQLLYEQTFKKWAEVIIPNGVPHNNWDLIQATFIVRIALALQPDSAYADGKGRNYYLDYVVNQSSLRQWSIKKLADYGFDPKTGIWFESPGYSIGVVKDYVVFADMMDREADIDLFEEMPIIEKAVFAAPQYLFPNRMICGFGDTHPYYISQEITNLLLAYAERHGKAELQERVKTLAAALLSDAPAADISRYVTSTFYAPNVSWLMQRTGMDAQRDLAISLNGALGNHQHANGISMELYGKGYVLGPDAGIGKVLYSGDDYKEYYSRFPAHNTVCVDGVSDHAVMMSQHPFEVQFLTGDSTSTVSQVSFVEPETQADQLRTNGIVKTPGGGYYVDIFRSRRRDEKDKFHDYFYHNMGQQMTLMASDGTALPLAPTEELAFAGGHLYAYSYLYDKHSATTDKDVRATFTTSCPDGRRIDMTMWMQGSSNREVFRALSPVNMEYERLGSFMPYKVDEQPVLTYVARQQGDAWTHPFVAIFEPSDTSAPSEIQTVEFFTPKGKDTVGIKVHLKNGRTDVIISTPDYYQLTSDNRVILTAKKTSYD